MYSYEEKKLILEHVSKFDIPSSVNAFGVKKSSIYLWQKKLLLNQNNTNILRNKSTRLLRVRTRVGKWDYRIEKFIQKTRMEYIGISHEKVHAMLVKEAKTENWKCCLPSKQTVARIICDLKKNHQIPNFKPNLNSMRWLVWYILNPPRTYKVKYPRPTVDP